MKSSSQFFPVTLQKADFWNDLSEDIYLLKPNNSPDRTVEFSATRLAAQKYCKEGLQRGRPVIFVHDIFQNRFVWMHEQQPLIEQLTEKGFDVWIMEMRGHGLSKVNKDYSSNSLNDLAEFDLPALQQFVFELNPTPAIWVGVGEGAVAVLRSLASALLKPEQIYSIHLLGLSRWKMLSSNRIPLVPSIKRLINRQKIFREEGSSEVEPRGVWVQLLKEQSFIGRKRLIGQPGRLRKSIPDLPVTSIFYVPRKEFRSLEKKLDESSPVAFVRSAKAIDSLTEYFNRAEAFPTQQ